MLIGAERVAGTGDPLGVENPYTEQTLETIGSRLRGAGRRRDRGRPRGGSGVGVNAGG